VELKLLTGAAGALGSSLRIASLFIERETMGEHGINLTMNRRQRSERGFSKLRFSRMTGERLPLMKKKVKKDG
jgi:hypothetical protein